MASVDYTFEKLCDSQRLTKEIEESAIIIALDYIQTLSSPATTNVWFKAALSEGDEIILAALVTAHVNTPLPENIVLPVDVRARSSYGAKTITLVDGTIKKLYARNTGLRFALESGSNELTYTATYPWVKLLGVECCWCEAGDYVDFKVYDNAAGTYSGVPNLLLNQFAFTLNLPKDFYRRESRFDADVYAGMVIKMTYQSASAKTIGLNLQMDEVKS